MEGSFARDVLICVRGSHDRERRKRLVLRMCVGHLEGIGRRDMSKVLRATKNGLRLHPTANTHDQNCPTKAFAFWLGVFHMLYVFETRIRNVISDAPFDLAGDGSFSVLDLWRRRLLHFDY